MKNPAPRIHFQKQSESALRIEKNFHPGTRSLRAHFEKKFQDPHSAKSERFCWDYWTVPGQYRLLRTPAESFFPKPLMDAFLSRLLAWGRERLGCQMISHPWLSAYVDGCEQNLHSDVPHGPFSFVYSLTPWTTRRFTGGETLVSKPRLLRYFSELQHDRSDEESDLFHAIPQPLGQLTVFDPRYPHGVRRVEGAASILESRLVIHGWFTDPRPMLEGALPFKKIMAPMDHLAHSILSPISATTHAGLLSLRFEISESGQIAGIEVLSAHLPDSSGTLLSRRALSQLLRSVEARFPRARGPSKLTLPLLIQR